MSKKSGSTKVSGPGLGDGRNPINRKRMRRSYKTNTQSWDEMYYNGRSEDYHIKTKDTVAKKKKKKKVKVGQYLKKKKKAKEENSRIFVSKRMKDKLNWIVQSELKDRKEITTAEWKKLLARSEAQDRIDQQKSPT